MELKTINLKRIGKQFKIQIAKIPLFNDKVHAGFPSPAEDHIESELDLNNYLITNPASTFMVKATGNSMIEAGINSGDLLVVDKSLSPKPENIVIASINGEFTVKRYKVIGKKVLLEPANPKYKTIEINEFDDAVIWGVVKHIIRSFG